MLRKAGLSLTAIGFASVLSLPWLLKVLWAPLVDRFGSVRFGFRRSWLVPCLAAMIAITVAAGFVTPAVSLVGLGLLFVLLNLAAATQDVAVDGLAVDLLEPDEMGPGNAAQVGGFKLGNIFGGGILLMLLGTLGWLGDFLVMAACLAAVLALVIVWPEAAGKAPADRSRTLSDVARRLFDALRAQPFVFLLFLVYAKFGETLGGAMVTPMLADHGITTVELGAIAGAGGGVATILGALAGGAAVRRYGWARTIGAFAIVQGAGLVAMGVAATGTVTPSGIAALLALDKFGGGGVAVAVFAVAMRHADREVGASHFTAAQVVYMTGALLAAPASGALSDAVSYSPVMIAGGLLAATLAVIAPWVSGRIAAS